MIEDSLEQEVWRSIPGYPEYEASSFGRIRSLPHIRVQSHGRNRPVGGNVLKGGPRIVRGRLASVRVTLCSREIKKNISIHRLVLLAFVGEAPPGMIGCHNDGNVMNNRLINLRWDTPKENSADMIRHGSHKGNHTCGDDHPKSKMTDQQVLELRSKHRTRAECAEIAERLAVSPMSVWYIYKGKRRIRPAGAPVNATSSRPDQSSISQSA